MWLGANCTVICLYCCSRHCHTYYSICTRLTIFVPSKLLLILPESLLEASFIIKFEVCSFPYLLHPVSTGADIFLLITLILSVGLRK